VKFARQGRPMTAKGMNAVCEMLGVGEAEVWAVLTVETRGFGFLLDRRPQILFERHIFSRRTSGRHDAEHPDISGRKPGGYKGGAGEYERLEKAMQLDEQEALKSASWGLPQVMGFNHRVVGFDSVTGMVEAIIESEDDQLEALGQFIMAHPKCRIGIQRNDWGSFAACYNGPNFRLNDYDNRLAAAYAKAKRMLPDLGLRGAQVALTYLGYSPGLIDGLRGRLTRGALVEFQTKRELPPTGELDAETEAKLLSEAFPS
jgi:N-acetylmuramidase/Putative peptidoglycan binding domain